MIIDIAVPSDKLIAPCANNNFVQPIKYIFVHNSMSLVCRLGAENNTLKSLEDDLRRIPALHNADR